MSAGPPLSFDAVPVRTPDGGPLAVELVPAPNPWDVARKLAHLPYLLFLDSAERHETRGRYSYVTADPFDTRCQYGRSYLRPLSAIRTKWAKLSAGFQPVPDLPPFQGGLAGVFGYGLARAFERVPVLGWDEFALPDVVLGFYDWVLAFDHASHRAWIVATGLPETDPDTRRAGAADRLDSVRALLAEKADRPRYAHKSKLPYPLYPLPEYELSIQYPVPGHPGVTSSFDRAGYEEAVRQAVEYVHAGDCFQVNLSQRLLAPLREHPLELYARLRRLNPAPFAAYFDAGEFQILSASPERFLRVYPNGEVETRPIKGTRPRGATPEEDTALIRDLAASPKDRAENVMIVDLLRNDIGKVCEYGSVRVPRVCEVETFRFVHHLVSEVRGKLRPGLGPLDLLTAAFPGGSVTGAPKVRAMEIIAELEPTVRGPYCGSLGWIGFDGAMDTNILIRTFTAGRGWVQFPVGGGIVADSDPAREYEETLHKAAGLLRALEKN
jgi:para-aminobenzoate synthetase component 1